MKVYKVTCDHGPPMIFRVKEEAEQEFQEHVNEECDDPRIWEDEMTEADFEALPEHPGW